MVNTASMTVVCPSSSALAPAPPTSAAHTPAMHLKTAFPFVLLVCNLGASAAYAATGDWRRAVYWAASSVCIAAVTF
jgi:hypothetical protein